MAITTNPYLFFNGQCREAMEFYKSILGGELYFQTYGEAHMADETPSDYVIHAALTGGKADLMASDTIRNLESGKVTRVNISLSGDDESLAAIFEKLCEGVVVDHPLEKAFWGDTFGAVTDKFGVDWMVSISAKK